MKIKFLGVGEAFDENQPNTSILLITPETKMLLDCGYSIFQQMLKHNQDPNYLDAIYISHVHGDHALGLPPLIKRMTEEQRSKKLIIICQKGDARLIKQIMHLGYRDSAKKTSYELEFKEIDHKDTVKFNELTLAFANTKHSLKNLAVRVTNQKVTFCYSGDGEHTNQSMELYKNADLLVHDGYFYDTKTEGHDNLVDVYNSAKKVGVKKLSFTHMQRAERKNLPTIVKKIKLFDIPSFVPSGGEIYTV